MVVFFFCKATLLKRSTCIIHSSIYSFQHQRIHSLSVISSDKKNSNKKILQINQYSNWTMKFRNKKQPYQALKKWSFQTIVSKYWFNFNFYNKYKKHKVENTITLNVPFLFRLNYLLLSAQQMVWQHLSSEYTVLHSLETVAVVTNKSAAVANRQGFF